MTTSPHSAAAREAARRPNGRFGEQERAEAAVDFLTDGPADTQGPSNELRATLLARLAADGLPGSLTVRQTPFDTDTTGRFLYAEEPDSACFPSGASFEVTALNNVVLVSSEATEASAESLRFTIGPHTGPGDVYERTARKVSQLLLHVRQQEADINASNAAFDAAWDRLADTPEADFTVVLRDYSNGTFEIRGTRPDESVTIGSFRFRDDEGIVGASSAASSRNDDGPMTFSVSLSVAEPDRAAGDVPAEYVAVINPGRPLTYHRFDDVRPMHGWEARALEQEVNRRAGLREQQSLLHLFASNLESEAVDTRPSPSARL